METIFVIIKITDLSFFSNTTRNVSITAGVIY